MIHSYNGTNTVEIYDDRTIFVMSLVARLYRLSLVNIS